MSPNALRHPALVVSVVAALGTATVAPAAAVAATHDASAPTSVASRGLLDGLLGGLTAPLTTVLTTLTTNPTAVLSPTTITTLLTEIPKVTAETVGGILDVLTPAQLAALVSDPTTIASPTALTTLLGGLLDTVTGLTQGVTAGGTSVPSATDVGSVLSQLQALLAGGVPSTAAGQTALVGILDQVTGLLGLPAVKDLPIVGDLLTTLRGLGSALPAPLSTAVTGLIDAVAGTGGTGTGTGTGTGGTGTGTGVDAGALASLLGLLGLGGATGGTGASGSGSAAKPTTSTTTAAKKVARARIVSVTVSKTRKRVVLRVSCPATAPAAGCKVKPSVKLGGRAVKVAKTATVRRGATRSLKAKVPASLAKKIRAKGGRVVVRVSTTGATAGAVTKTVKVRRAAR
ncbi:hypothetical protein AB0L40_17715 [Patulibacter sp. NPDC049589]|uniref:hypothetical protein n=1 Tax=Patulibacter sp. NPDC049589 TaxID=3154731 RepID=UPI00341E982E